MPLEEMVQMCDDLPALDALDAGQDWLRIVIPVDLAKANEARLREAAGDAAVRALRERRKVQ